MSDRTVARSLGNLVLALLNATLILTALCLWLAWSAFSAAERVSADLRAAAEVVLPLREEAQALTAERGGSVSLNRVRAFSKWFSAWVMPPPRVAPAS